MDRKKLALLGGAMVVAMATALAARSMFAGAAAPQAIAIEAPVPAGPKVLVARRGLPVGTIISADAVSYQPWPSELVQDAYFVDGEASIDKLLGTVVRYPITAGEPVTQGSLVKPGDRGFLAAALGAGMRAVTVDVSARTGVAGFVFPGDRVDIILTQSVTGEGQPLRATETIMRNVRVLATDQSAESTTEEGKTLVQTFRTVTLEVTPRMAEKIAVSEQIGTLSLSLRSIADSQGELDQALAAGEIDLPPGATPAQEEQLLRAALARPMDVRGSFVTGGDVSRFQRSTMPRTDSAVATPAPSQPAANVVAVPAGPAVRVTRGQQSSLVPVAR
ncbi:pilus assembly protein CpaB [Croceibacterium mercuriale]|uniref:Pilus assembly protein CpaB n=1 Tax=Croceibacterium mercuriale TaxID=1572751 RepID=A0A0B2BZ40_9SPHN|nr:Flp pilus assembly protein CpaB [Croceibacterium mercuriale]KHL25262.1 pilus assembly protein CpaB [Croceibacterium mercuriale]